MRTSSTLDGVTYGNSTFVAVGGDGAILTSPDGVTWTSRTSGTGNSLEGITYGNSTFVAVGEGGTILQSAPSLVISTSPARDARGVSINSAVTATFSDEMDSSTINTSTFTLSGGVLGTVSYKSSTKTATFTPSFSLGYANTYTATITTGVKDSAGNPIASVYSWSFTTGSVVPTPTPSPTTSPDLLEKYAPILYMHGQERFHPTKVEVMLDNSELIKKRMGKDKTVYKNEGNTLTLDMLVSDKYNTEKHYLKLKKDAEEAAKDKDVYWYWKKEQTVYGRQFTSNEYATKTVLQYWFFYVYNDWGTSVELGNSHQGDWEMVQIVLNSDEQPEMITYGFHHGGQSFEWGKEEVGKSEDGNHPLVYVTLGGHGCWNQPENNTWYQEMKSFGCQECIDETADDGDVLYPSAISENEIKASSKKYPYKLEDLSNISAGHWVHWKGYWGNQTEEKKVADVGSSGPSSPPYIDYISKNSNYPRWKFPIKWAKSPLPSSYTVCASDNSKVIPHDLKGISVSYNEYCSTDSDRCGKQCSSIKIAYSEEDLVFDVYSLDGKEVDLKISRHKKTGEVYEVEFNWLEIPKNGKATLRFSQEQNPNLEMEIDHDHNGIFDYRVSPDYATQNP